MSTIIVALVLGLAGVWITKKLVKLAVSTAILGLAAHFLATHQGLILHLVRVYGH